MDCKRALTETSGDIDAAVALLRERGLASAAKKAGRVAAEGLVGIFPTEDGTAALMLELNCETDFVAKNDQFAALLDTIGAGLLAAGVQEGTGESVAELDLGGGKTVADLLTESVASIGENIGLRRFTRLNCDDGLVGCYVHAGGKIGVLVELEGGAQHGELAKSLAMQVAAAFPRYVHREEVPEEDLETEREIFRNQALASGKPEKILDRIIAGKLEKFYGEICLLEQEFVRDSDLTVAKLLDKSGAESGASLAIRCFVRYQLGEGIEKKEGDLAREVAEQIAQGS